ncbi:MAG: hypothetical protein JWO05_1471 [Gemmatimonadetes bacterium]|nr:hypothetical protein [Gemmatimonadota bacterium]
MSTFAMVVLGDMFAALGSLAIAYALVCERRMHRFRQPGVSYWQATMRLDGGWRRAELFTDEGLLHQRGASAWAVVGVTCWALAMVLWLVVMRRG